ncbi:TPA: hypothetical protein NKO30_006566 [Pseudomonas aeruginosa]|nr:hypothetical protein [Pseudomonas aeruginosa]
MLSLARRGTYIAIFMFVLTALLALGLLFERVGSSDQMSLTLRVTKSSVGAAAYFLVMSGYGFLYPLVYIASARRLTAFQRRTIALALFSTCLATFFLFFADAWFEMQFVMFGVGVASVLAADFCAGAVLSGSRH